jgi:acyl-CoA thioester hydrolase
MTAFDLKDRGSYRDFETVTVRFSDQDPMGHVNNVAITAFFEAGRVGLINRLRSEIDLSTKGIVLAHISVDYRREVHFPGSVEVGGRLTGVGGKSFSTAFGLFQNGVCCATSTAVMVFFDAATRTAMAPPETVRQALIARVAAEEAA